MVLLNRNPLKLIGNTVNTKDKIDELKFAIGRFDHYFDTVNNKGNLYLTINTFILGGSIVGYYTLDQRYEFNDWVLILAFIPFVLCSLVSFTYTLIAIKPYARKGKGGTSLLFFGDVSQQATSAWSGRWASLSQDEWQMELQTQSLQLAKGLNRKFECLGCATLFIWLEIIIIGLFSFYLFIL